MLVLSRRAGEDIVLVRNGELLGVVRVAHVNRARVVRVGLQLPPDVKIHRREACNDPNIVAQLPDPPEPG